MTTLRTLFLFAVLGVLLSGCAYIDVTAPGAVYNSTEYKLTANDFTVLDRVSVTGETTLWFGAVLTGGKGYQDLLAESKKLGGDNIMDYSFDVEQTSVLLFIYSRVRWKATALAVKYAKHVYQTK